MSNHERCDNSAAPRLGNPAASSALATKSSFVNNQRFALYGALFFFASPAKLTESQFFTGLSPHGASGSMWHGEGLGAVGTNADGTHGAADDLSKAFYVGLAVGRQLFPRGAFRRVLHPAWQYLINRCALFPVIDEGRGALQRGWSWLSR